MQRVDFPLLNRDLVYFDSAATSQKPSQVIDALSDFYKNHYGTVHRSVYHLAAVASEMYHAARDKGRAFLNAKEANQIIFTRGTTESINLVASSFGKAFIQPGDEILLSEIEHHSNIVPWQFLREERGAVIKTIPVNDAGELDLVAYQNLLSPKTKMVAIAHVSNVVGTVHPVKEITRLAHLSGAKVLIDGAQAAPHQIVDVQDINCDYYVFSGHKAFGPTGIGILYGKEMDALPPYQGGGDMIDHVTFEKTTYNVSPLKFEAGTPIIAESIGLGAALDYIESIGRDKIHAYEQKLLLHATEALKQIPRLTIYGNAKEKGPLISFNVEGIHHLDIGTLLDLKKIAVRTGHLCSQPAMKRFGVTGVVRASFALYNTIEEIDYFIKSLKEVIATLER